MKKLPPSDAVNEFFGDNDADDAYRAEPIEPTRLLANDASIPMDVEEAKDADKRARSLYHEGQRVSRNFSLETYWIYVRDGWKRLGFDSWEAYYKKRFPLLDVKYSYRLMKAQEVRLQLEPVSVDVPKVLELPAAAILEIAKLPKEQQAEAALLTVKLAEEKVIQGDGAKYQAKAKEDRKPCVMDAKRAVAEIAKLPPPAVKPRPKNYRDDRLPTPVQLAELAFIRTVQSQHISLNSSSGSACIRIELTDEEYRQARAVELPVAVIIGLLEAHSYTVTWQDPCIDDDDEI